MESETSLTGKSLQQGELIVDQITLINPEGAAFEITGLVSNLRFFESIEKYFVSGRLTLVDSIDLIKILKVVGQESITIQIRGRDDSTDGDGHYSKNENQIDKAFRVYAVSDEKITEIQNTKSYVLHFIDHKYFLANQVRLNKVMYGSYSKMLLQEWKDLLFKNKEEPKTLTDYWDESYPYNRQLVCPDWTLSQLIDFCKMHASYYDDAFSNGFFFYGTLFGSHRFISFDSMLRNLIPVKFDTRPRNITVGTDSSHIDAPFTGLNTQILKYERVQRANTVKSMFDGTYASNQNVYDPVKKQMHVIRFEAKKDIYDNLQEHHKKMFPLIRLGVPDIAMKTTAMDEEGNYDVNAYEYTIPDGILAAEAKGTFRTYNANLFTNSSKTITPFDEEGELTNLGWQPPMYRDDSLLKRNALTSLLDQYVVKVTIPFRPDISVGSMISLNLPDINPGVVSKKMANDEFLITKATYDISPNTNMGFIHLVCSKISYDVDVASFVPEINFTEDTESL
tara:strand:- start:421 stop:1944 length:1524 start_codon:yes stop_codon:yes gene_type:complete